MKRGLLFACVSFGIALVGTQPVVGQTTTSPSLAGSWDLTLLPLSPTAAPLIPISGLATFTSDGSVVETDATEAVPTVGSTGMVIYGRRTCFGSP
jgi:hypothetical protein